MNHLYLLALFTVFRPLLKESVFMTIGHSYLLSPALGFGGLVCLHIPEPATVRRADYKRLSSAVHELTGAQAFEKATHPGQQLLHRKLPKEGRGQSYVDSFSKRPNSLITLKDSA